MNKCYLLLMMVVLFSCDDLLDMDLNSELNPPDWMIGEWAKVKNNGDVSHSRELFVHENEICKEGLFEITNCSFPLNSVLEYSNYYVDEEVGDDYYRINLIPIHSDENLVKVYFKLTDDDRLLMNASFSGNREYERQ